MMRMQRRVVLQGLSAVAGGLLLSALPVRAQAAPGFKVGDRYGYQRLDPYSGAEQGRYTIEVTQVTGDEIVCSDGRVLDQRGFPRRLPDGRRFRFLQAPAANVRPGGSWRTEFVVTMASGEEIRTEMDGSVLGRERITVPAGSFDALRIEGSGIAHAPLGSVRTQLLVYRAPDQVRMPLLRQEVRRNSRGMVFFAERDVLIDYRQT